MVRWSRIRSDQHVGRDVTLATGAEDVGAEAVHRVQRLQRRLVGLQLGCDVAEALETQRRRGVQKLQRRLRLLQVRLELSVREERVGGMVLDVLVVEPESSLCQRARFAAAAYNAADRRSSGSLSGSRRLTMLTGSPRRAMAAMSRASSVDSI